MPGYRAYGSLRAGLTADVGRAIAMATGGAAVFVPIEYVLALWTYTGETPVTTKLKLVALTVTLAAFLWLALVAGLAAASIVTRLVRARFAPETGRGRGLFELAPITEGIRPGVPLVWAYLVVALGFAGALQRAATWAMTGYKEPTLIAILIAITGLAIAIAAALAKRVFVIAATVAARAFAGLGAFNPLGRWRAAAVALAILVEAGLVAAWYLVPPTRSYLNVRLVTSAIVIGFGIGLGLRYLRRPRAPQRAHGLALAGGAFVVVTTTLLWGADPETKSYALTASPAMERLLVVVRTLNDIDRDGYGSLLGENDCDPWNPRIHPGDAVDIPDDGIDQNCDGRDFSLASLDVPTGPTMPLPAADQHDWNILFLTIDALRYDHTTFGGYAKGPKARDTTPNLAKLVARSSSFVYAQSPSAGTMASIPAILTSKFFHSGIALDEKRPAGTPPGILPENTLLPEIMKRGGYHTGVIGSHEWWTGWGLEQGVDDYDNTIGEKPDPRRVVANKITDHALAWISRQQGKKWFLWAHYIDPHGVYVAHPDVVDYGSSDADLYDAEIKWTDQEVGRLLDELVRLPSYANTIIIITADHGENMGEHGGTLGTHGFALNREQVHVPLVFFIPEHKPQQLRGAVTNLDVVPTVAAIAGIDVSDLTFEGRSLVPQLFYGQEDRDRIVFAETNAPGKQRAAISERTKLIFHLNNNFYELYDSKADPDEKTNLAAKAPPEFELMKRALEQWMARVLYARDPLFNQAYRQISDVILSAAVTPPVASPAHVIDDKIEILGIGPAANKPWAPGAKADIHVYLHVRAPAAIPYRFSLVVWPAAPSVPPTDPTTPQLQRGPSRATADGAYPADRWKAGDYIRERFPFNIPADWKAGGVAVGLVVTNPTNGERLKPAGPTPSNDPYIHFLGVIPLGSLPGPGP
ncbi:MAG: sulfatase-like hydrolase/transferase [Kofleriaceae bacterium]